MTKFKSQHQKGFTLIELMIAISILSLLLFTGSYSYSLMSERWNKELGQFSQSAKEAKHLEIVQRLLEGIQTFVVVNNKQKPSLFFIGDTNSLLAVSQAGFFNNNYPEIFRLTTIKNKKGLFDLVYQSASTENILLTGTDQTIDFTKKIVLFENLEKVTFQYYGWSHYYDKDSTDEGNKSRRWFDNFSGINNQIMPEQFILTLNKAGNTLSFPVYLDNSSERWLSPYLDENS